MGLKWVLQWLPATSPDRPPAGAPEAARIVEAMGGVRVGRWQSSCSVHMRNIKVGPDIPTEVAGARDVTIVTFSDAPDRRFLLLRPDRLGLQFSMGDFAVKVGRGSLSHGESMRGVMLEVEYKPVSMLPVGRPMVHDFVMQWQVASAELGFKGRFSLADPNYADYGLGQLYTMRHTASQYAMLCSAMLQQMQRPDQ
eukprot:jgi/Chlat1/2794/Chrsp187S02954